MSPTLRSSSGMTRFSSLMAPVLLLNILVREASSGRSWFWKFRIIGVVAASTIAWIPE